MEMIMAVPLLATLLAITGGIHTILAAPASKPNILFLMVDEMDGRVMDSASPHFKPPMPSLWKLAESGAHFPIAYSNAPQCVPARTSMMSGRHNSQMHVWDNFVGIASVKGSKTNVDPHCIALLSEKECQQFASEQYVNGTFIDVLHEGGYNVTMYGKMHVGAGLEQYQGSIQEFPFSKGGSKAAMEWSRATGITPTQKVPTWQVPDNDPAPASAADYMATSACSDLLTNGLFKSSTPQFLYCSIIVPHPPYRTNSTYLELLPSLGNQSIPNWRNTSNIHPSDEYTMKVKHSWLTDQSGAADVEHFRRVYFSMCIEANELMGRILDGLAAGGGMENTYVVFISDHGEHALENRQTGKNSMLEASSRVPFILTGPTIAPGQVLRDNFASLNDIYPTILDIAGLTANGIPDPVGESLLPLAEGKTKTKQRRFVTSEYHSVYSGTGIFMVRDKDLKYVQFAPVRNTTWPPQLFNLTSDPWEHNNIADQDPDEVSRLAALLATQYNILQADGDKKEFDKAMFTKYWYTPQGGSSKCLKSMEKVYAGFNATTDGPIVEAWLGQACN